MAHIRYDITDKTSAVTPEWLRAGANFGSEVNRVAARSDLVVVMGPGLGMGAPACFIPATAEVQINTDECFPGVRPDDLSTTDRLVLLANPAGTGACIHEAAHAKHTRIDLKALHARTDVTPRHIDILIALEEPRIEGALLRSFRYHSKFGALTSDDIRLGLSTCAAEIVLRDFHIANTPYGASVAAALLLARVDAGVLKPADVAVHKATCESVLGVDTLNTLRSLWREFLALDDTDIESMIRIAKEWVDALAPDGGEGGKGEPGEGEGGKGEGDGKPGEGTPGEGEDYGDLSGGALIGKEPEPSTPEEWQETIADAIRKWLTEKDSEATEARGDERATRRAAERAADAERRGAATAASHKAFGGGHGYTDTESVKESRSMEPDADIRRGVVILSKALAKVDYTDASVARVNSVVPPGRLRSRKLVAEEVERERGGLTEVATWNGKRRTHTDETPLTVGFIQDVSGSMREACVPTAVASWVMQEAGRRVDAKVATVLMGREAFGTTRPGARSKDIKVYPATAGSEAFKESFLALDGVLNLIDSDGARLLVIASDACLVNSRDDAYARTAMALCKSRGVAVVWLDFTGDFESNHGYGEVIDCVRKNPAEVASLVGAAVIKAFKAAKKV